MRSSALLSALLLFAPLFAPQASPAQVTVIAASPNTACPVSFDVRRNSPGLVAEVDDPGRHPGSQRIYLSVRPTDERSVHSVQLTVHALAPGSRLYPIGSDRAPAPKISRQFDLAVSGQSTLDGRNLWVRGVAGIVSVDLTSVTYTDGSEWHVSPGSFCHAVPNGYTLVGASASH